jgi:hypothetical protein
MSMTSDPRKNDVPLRPDWEGVETGESPMLTDDNPDNPPRQEGTGHYASAEELLDFTAAALPDSVFEKFPGLYYDQVESKDEPDYFESLNYRQIPFGGGWTNSPGPGLLAGFNLDEAAGAAAYVRIHDGYDANAPILASVRLLANTSKESWPSKPIRYRFGIYVEVVTGTIDGVIYLSQLKVK